jgi:uncharacterized protein with FMN-binding domain
MLKKIGVVIGVIIIIGAVGMGLMIYRLNGMASKIKCEETNIVKIDLKKIPDGDYSGSYGDFVVSAKVKVTVKNHRISDVVIMEQSCGKGYNALNTVDRIIKAQSPKVDAVTGASNSSKTIMIAVYRALKQGIKK